MGTGDFPGLGGRDLEDGLRVHVVRFSFFFPPPICRREHEPRKFRIRPDAAGTERSINFFFFRWFGDLLS